MHPSKERWGGASRTAGTRRVFGGVSELWHAARRDSSPFPSLFLPSRPLQGAGAIPRRGITQAVGRWLIMILDEFIKILRREFLQL